MPYLLFLDPDPGKIVDTAKNIEDEALQIDNEIETLIPRGLIGPLRWVNRIDVFNAALQGSESANKAMPSKFISGLVGEPQ